MKNKTAFKTGAQKVKTLQGISETESKSFQSIVFASELNELTDAE